VQKQQIASAVVVNIMARPFAAAAEAKPLRGSVVRRPCASDPIGGALRSIYGQNDSLPLEMELLLRRLDQVGQGVRAH
jgi:hypothetical protein